MKRSLIILLLVAMQTALTSCEIVGDIFKAGMYWGIFLVIGVIALIFYLVFRIRR